VASCAPEPEAWQAEFRRVVNELQQNPHTLRVSREALLQHFSWLRIAREMVESYRNAVAAESRQSQPTNR
jgi:hypothetical protein